MSKSSNSPNYSFLLGCLAGVTAAAAIAAGVIVAALTKTAAVAASCLSAKVLLSAGLVVGVGSGFLGPVIGLACALIVLGLLASLCWYNPSVIASTPFSRPWWPRMFSPAPCYGPSFVPNPVFFPHRYPSSHHAHQHGHPSQGYHGGGHHHGHP
jgi:hypothetical protein